ncbi:MAG: rhomboid family intramembrane serine protease [Desulfobacteraceae bacterium]|nr:rhomboid family intramembrane serine protease [Desulfobacteraceae bacterium]
MIPVRDTQPSECFPIVTYTIMGLNLLVFLFQFYYAGFQNEQFYFIYGLVPAKYTIQEISMYFPFSNQVISIFTYMFLHGGFIHFIGNMWTLYIFGDNVEDHLGSMRYLGFYILCGLISGLAHFLLNPFSKIPTIGASGAIAGVMGAYFLLYPRSRILTIIPIIIIPWFLEIPAYIFLGVWFLIQFFNAAIIDTGASIAWWAHIGGFIAGIVLVLFLKKLPKSNTSEKLSQLIRKKKTPKIQTIATRSPNESPHVYGALEITSNEAVKGTIKLISIPWGFYKPLYKVKVPPGVRHGTKLRLAGMGKTVHGQLKGDMYLDVQIKNAI